MRPIVRMLDMRLLAIALTTLTVAATVPVTAQAQVTSAVASAVDRARGLMDAGSGDAARTLLDSLVTQATPGSDDMGEALYWRAVLSESAADAERDWKRLVIEVPLSTRAPNALLRLGELEVLRGRPAAARVHFERILRDFPEASQRPTAEIWIARSYFEERDVTNACRTVGTLQTSGMPAGELQLQLTELQARCRNAAPTTTTGAATATPSTSAPPKNTAAPPATTVTEEPAPVTEGANRVSGVIFTVQLAAYNTRAEANAYVARLAKRGIKARIDGDRKPFRVRVGRYDTRDAAATMLAKLKKQGQNGFLAELPK
jgi:cell division septation protein DedD